MYPILESLKYHAPFFNLKNHPYTITHEDEEKMVLKEEDESYFLLKEAENIRRALPEINVHYILPIEYEADLGEKKTTGYVTWIKTEHITIQYHYFLEDEKIDLDVHVMEYREGEKLNSLPVAVQSEIKEVINRYRQLVEKKHKLPVILEKETEQFLAEVLVQVIPAKANKMKAKNGNTDIFITDWNEMLERYIQENKTDGLSIVQIIYKIEEEYHSILTYSLFRYVAMTKFIQLLEKEETTEPWFFETIKRRQKKHFLYLSDKQKTWLENHS